MVHNSVTYRGESLIALGANLPSVAGKPEDTLRSALDRLGDSGLKIVAVSRLFRTPCFPPGAGPDYVNAAAIVGGEHDPDRLLSLLHRTEAAFGRQRQVRWGSRVLDLDLLAMADMVRPDRATFDAWARLSPQEQRQRAPDRPIVPHPRLQERAFVLIPLCDIAPGWRHPVSGLTVREMAEALPDSDRAGVVPL